MILVRSWCKFFISSYQLLLERFSSIYVTFRDIQKSSHEKAQVRKLTNIWVRSLALAYYVYNIEQITEHA